MLRVALKMLVGDRTKYAGCSSASHSLRSWSRSLRRIFAGFITRGFALIAENPSADVWVMHPAVESAEQDDEPA